MSEGAVHPNSSDTGASAVDQVAELLTGGAEEAHQIGAPDNVTDTPVEYEGEETTSEEVEGSSLNLACSPLGSRDTRQGPRGGTSGVAQQSVYGRLSPASRRFLCGRYFIARRCAVDAKALQRCQHVDGW